MFLHHNTLRGKRKLPSILKRGGMEEEEKEDEREDEEEIERTQPLVGREPVCL